MLCRVALTPLALAAPLMAQDPHIGSIDLYGLRTITPQQVRRVLHFHVGDTVPLPVAAIERRLRSLPGVASAEVSYVCCESGKTIVYVGILERWAPALVLHAEPRGTARLPGPVLAAAAAFDSALVQAVRRGDFAEDGSEGHALLHDPEARAVQERFVYLAAAYRRELRAVLRESADASQRAIAAQLLAYAADKREIVDDLVYATRDPSPEVRNNATRALALIAGLAQRAPQLGFRVPYEPFVEMLNSVVWSDRNKSSMAIFTLSETRDPALLALLCRRALPALVEMARWTSPGHAKPAYFTLGRIAGIPDADSDAAFTRGDRELVITAAERRCTTSR